MVVAERCVEVWLIIGEYIEMKLILGSSVVIERRKYLKKSQFLMKLFLLCSYFRTYYELCSSRYQCSLQEKNL